MLFFAFILNTWVIFLDKLKEKRALNKKSSGNFRGQFVEFLNERKKNTRMKREKGVCFFFLSWLYYLVTYSAEGAKAEPGAIKFYTLLHDLFLLSSFVHYPVKLFESTGRRRRDERR